MKKTLLLLLLSFIGVSAVFPQEEKSQFPFGKMLKMSHEELIDAKFIYYKKKNQYVLTKVNELNNLASFVGIAAGIPINYIPTVDDYQVTIQRGENEVSFINVTFYDSEIYHKIITFAMDKGLDFLETNAGSSYKAQFNYADYAFEVNYGNVAQSSVSIRNEEYTTYNFTIYTGVEPSSEWLTKQAEKECKRNEAGRKKRSAMDLM